MVKRRKEGAGGGSRNTKSLSEYIVSLLRFEQEISRIEIYAKQLQVHLGHYQQSAREQFGLPKQKQGVIKSDGHVAVIHTSTQTVCGSTSIQLVI